jgi:hypothetical protein
MEIAFYVRPAVIRGKEWVTADSWPDGEVVPRKGELVKVTVGATDGAQVQREMRVIEVCHAGPHNAQVWLVPTNVKVTSI